MLTPVKFSAFRFSLITVSMAHASFGMIVSPNLQNETHGLRHNHLKISFVHSTGSSSDSITSKDKGKKIVKKITDVKTASVRVPPSASNEENTDEGSSAAPETGDRIFDVDHVSVLAKPLNNIKPVYPDEALRRGIEASVRVLIIVDENGIPVEAHSMETMGFGLDQAAEEAAKELKFSPAQVDSTPVKVKLIWIFHFRLSEG